MPFFALLYFLIPKKNINTKNSLLLVASLIFYAWGEMVYLWLLFLSIIGNYFFGRIISQNNSKTNLLFAIFFNLSLLLYFKYAHFIAQNITIDVNPQFLPQHLPIGISFFTFHAISYLVDIYRKKAHVQKNLFTLALYIAFFPQLVAGPIVRYNFIEKYLSKRRQSWFFASYGVRRFIIGLGKKVIIANPLGQVADAIFSSQISEISPFIAWVGIISYTAQIYFDFSGYCDMAIGLARIFGFKFPENFNYPYVSRSIKEFWRRWHISLSTWFRDYVYIPLGGNKVSPIRQYFNLILVFFLCGLWHGASWNFIIWGLFHGLFLVIERIDKINAFLCKLPIFLQRFYAMFVVIIGWVFFRSSDLTSSVNYLQKMFSFNQATEIVIANNISQLLNSNFTLTVVALAMIGYNSLVRDFCLKLIRKNRLFLWFFDVILLLIFVFCAVRLSASTHNPFIYFQF